MAKKKSGVVANGDVDSKKEKPRSAAILDRELRHVADVIAAGWAVAGDLANIRFSAGAGNAIGKNLGIVLKAAELQVKYGGGKALRLLGSTD